MRVLVRAAPILAVVVLGCGVRTKRDIDVPGKEVTYNDLCNLQSYFDQRAAASLAPITANDESIAQNEKGQTIGEGTYSLKEPLARRRFARLLRDEYSGVDDKFLRDVDSQDGDVKLYVKWWDAGPIHRVRPNDDILLETRSGTLELPPNVCVSDFLFGDRVYEMRARYLKNEVQMATDTPVASSEPAPSPPPTPAPSSSDQPK